MKRILLLLALVTVTTIGLIAKDGVRKETTKNESKTEETIIYNKSNDKAIQKCVCDFNSENQMTQKTIYKPDRRGNWAPSYKLEMTYTVPSSTKPCTVTYTKWNPIRERWEEKSETMECIK